MPDLTGKTLGRYTILERVGRGGMADVYRAHQPSLDRDVAIKVLNPFLLDDSANSDRFRREAKVVATLHHSNIVQVLDYDNEGETFYMVMAYIEGRTLKAVLDAHAAHGTRLSLGEIGAVMTAIGSALSYAHSRGMVHRDIKPHNIMFTAEGTPMLTDFGIARMVQGSMVSVVGGLSGTPAYMSPEQGKGDALDARSDIYSLGVVLYEMLTSRVPFAADTPFAVIIKHMNDPLPPPRSVNPAIPEPLERVVLRALAKNPAERYQTVDELVQATQAAIATAQGAGATTIPAMLAPVPEPGAPEPMRTARVVTATPVPVGAVIVCPKCGGNNPAGSRYCDQCSAPLDGTVPPRNRSVGAGTALVAGDTLGVSQPVTLPLEFVSQPPPLPVTPTAPPVTAVAAVITPAAPLTVPIISPVAPPPMLPAARPASAGGLSPALLVGALLAIGLFLGAGLIALLTSKPSGSPVDPAAQATAAAISVQSTQLVVQQLALQTTMTAASGLSSAAQETAVAAATVQAQRAAGTATALGVVAADSAATAQTQATGTALAGSANVAGQATAVAQVTTVTALSAQAAVTAQAQAQAATQAAVEAQGGTATSQAQAAGQAQAAAQTQTATAAQAAARSQTTAAAQATAAARTAGQIAGRTATAQAASSARQVVAARSATALAQVSVRQAATVAAQLAATTQAQAAQAAQATQAAQAAQTVQAAQAAQVVQTAQAAQAQAAIGRQLAAQTATAQAQAAAQALAAAQAAQTVAAAQTATAQAQAGQEQGQAATAQVRIAATGTAIALAQAAAIDTRVARGYATATARAAQAAAPPTALAGCSAGGSRSGAAAPSTLHVGDTVQFTATGFTGGEAVSFWFTAPNGEVDGTAAPVPGGVHDDGSVNFKPVRIPADFAQNYGRWAITVQGATSGHQAVIFFCVVK